MVTLRSSLKKNYFLKKVNEQIQAKFRKIWLKLHLRRQKCLRIQ